MVMTEKKSEHFSHPYMVCRIVLILLVSIGGLQAGAQQISPLPKKKLIDFGWNSPSTAEFRKNIKKYENGPFDGVAIKLPGSVGGGNIFMVKDLRHLAADSMQLEHTLDSALPASAVLTDNFVVLYGGSQMNWFSDDDWLMAEKNIRYAANLAKNLRCKGILWDPEPYKPGKNPWKYDEQAENSSRSFEEYSNQVRKRGSQFVKALQSEFPGLTVLSLREFSDFQNGSPFSQFLLPVKHADSVKKELGSSWWGLHIAFSIGILEAMEDNVQFIDCNEEAYYYTSALEFYKARNTLKNEARAFVPENLRSKFASGYSVGAAISADYPAGNWANVITFPFALSGQGKMLSAAQKALWFEHNAYYALLTADEYAWLYTESSNWWTNENIPAGFKEALLRAKQKANQQLPLGFEVENMLKDARLRAAKQKK
jgi:hypothetical protein